VEIKLKCKICNRIFKCDADEHPDICRIKQETGCTCLVCDYKESNHKKGNFDDFNQWCENCHIRMKKDDTDILYSLMVLNEL